MMSGDGARTADFDYALPPELIAQDPLPARAGSRMLVLPRGDGPIVHAKVTAIVRYLAPGDLLVVNNTKVFPARLRGRRADTGGRVELLLTHRVRAEDQDEIWEALMRCGFRARRGIRLTLAEGQIEAELLAQREAGCIRVRLQSATPLAALIDRYGEIPLPPYIKRSPDEPTSAHADRERYQTVYARCRGAVAAPTAGLHFTPQLLDDLSKAGVEQTQITLHVGPGTFRPVTSEDPADHVMDAEWFEVGDRAAARIEAARAAGRRVVAVGTTTVRTLETVAMEHGTVVPAAGWSRLFIRPPFTFKAVDALLTNFHLPRSTLLMLVSAFCDQDTGNGRRRTLDAYHAAVKERYRFYSYGDGMLLL